MPKVAKKSEKPDSSVSKELKKSASFSKTFPDAKRKIFPGPKDNVKNKKKSKKVAHQYKEPHQKLINMVAKQSDLRKQIVENITRDLSKLVNQVELDFTNFTEVIKIFQQRTVDHVKFLDYSATAMSEIQQVMKDMSASYKTKFDELKKIEEEYTAKLCEEINNELKEFQDNLVSESRRAASETV